MWMRVEVVCAVLMAAAVAWSLSTAETLPTNDGPQHIFAGYVTNHLDEHGWAERYEPNTATSSNGYHGLFRVLEPALGWRGAHRAIVIGAVLLWATLWFLLLRQGPGRGAGVALFAFPCSLQWAVWIGLLPFLLSSAGIPLVLLARRRAWPAPVMAALLLLTAYLHMFGAALAGFVLVLDALGAANRWQTLRTTVLIGLPAFAYVVWVTARSEAIQRSGTVWEATYDPVARLLEFFLPGPYWTQVFFLIVVLVAMWRGLKGSRAERHRLAVGLVLLTLGLMLPLDVSGWQLVSPRIIPVGYLLVVSCLVVTSPLGRAGVFAAAWVFTLARVEWTEKTARAAAAEVAPMLALPADLNLDGQIWAYVVTAGPTMDHALADVRLASASLHVGQLAALQLGGQPVFSHDGLPSVHHIMRRETPPTWLGSVEIPSVVMPAWDLTGAIRDRDLFLLTYLQKLSLFDALVVYGLKGDGDLLVEAGFVIDRTLDVDEDLAIFVAHFEGCPWTLTFDADPQPVVVAVGFGRSTTTQDAMILHSATETIIDAMPCGPTWISADISCREERGEFGIVPLQATDGVAFAHCTEVPPTGAAVPGAAY